MNKLTIMDIKLNSKIVVDGSMDGKEFDNQEGTVIGLSLPHLLVEFDNNINGHNGSTISSCSKPNWEGAQKGKARHCWYILTSCKSTTITDISDDGSDINDIADNILKKLV